MAILMWDPVVTDLNGSPLNAGGAGPVQVYRIYACDSPSPCDKASATLIGTNSTGPFDLGSVPPHPHYFVTAVNEMGEGPMSDVANIPPAAPQNVRIV